MAIRLGLFTGNVGLHVLSRTDILQKNLRLSGFDPTVKWVTIEQGHLEPDLLGANVIDLGGTGSTPPITGQARGIPLVYVATSAPRPFGGFVVRQDSKIQKIYDLRGKTISLALGAWPTQVLAVALDRAGLTFDDVLAVDAGEESLEALEELGIDAWIGTIPGSEAGSGYRYIAKVNDFVSNPSVYTARRDFAEGRPDLLKIVVQSLDEAERWAERNPEKYGEFFANSGRRRANSILSRSVFGLRAISRDFLAEQQKSADIFHRFGYIRRAIDVTQATLPEPIFTHELAA